MKRKLLILTIALLLLSTVLAACGNRAIDKMTVTEGLKYKYALNETPDFSGVKATLTYNDGTTLEVTAEDLTFSTLDTSTPGTKKLTISYGDFSLTIDVTVEGASLGDDDGALISIAIISSSIKTTILTGETLDTSTLQVTATFEKGSKTVSASELTISAIDTSTAGNKTLTVSYGDKSTSIIIKVEDPPHITGIEVDGDSIDTTVEEGETVDVTNLKVYAVYSNGTRELLANSALTITQPNTETVGDKVLVIAYGSFEKRIPVSAVPPTLESIKLNAGSYATKLVILDTFATDGITATAYYSNDTSKQLTAAQLTITPVDTATAGEKTLTVTYEGKTDSATVTVLGVTSVVIDKSSIKTTLTQGDTLNTATLKATVTYSDTTTHIVTIDELSVVTAPDTATPGKKTLTVAHKGVEASVEITVDVNYEILGVALPNSLASFETNGQRFKDKNAVYVVGDDNPFIFRLVLQAIDENDNHITNLQKYISTSTVVLIEGSNETPVGTEYVTIDEVNNGFDFTEAAIGKIFKITTRPLYGVEGFETECTRSFTVKVVDGYNVTVTKELHLMTNHAYKELPDDVTLQKDVAVSFVNANFGQGYYETYGGDSLKGIILHNNLDVTVDDLPTSYIITYNNKVGFGNHFSVFYHMLTAANPTFTIYGNYFTVNSRTLPGVVDNDISSSELIRFSVDDAVCNADNYQYYNPDMYDTRIENLALRNDDPNEDNVDNNAKHMTSLIALKTAHNDFEIYNSVVEAFSISVVVENMNTNTTLNKVTFNNAWQGHVYAWLNNAWQEWNGHDSLPTAEGINPLKLTIKESTLTKCGGPVILAQQETEDSSGAVEPYNQNARIDLIIDDASEIWAYVTGGEAWFQAWGKAELAASLIALDTPLSGNAAGYAANGIGQNSTMLTTQEGTGDTKFVNFAFACIDGGKATITKVDSKLFDSTDPTVQAHLTAGAGTQGAPLFQSSNGGYGTYVGGTDILSPTLQPLTSDTANAAKLFSGEYLGIHVGNMLVVAGYYH
ncbi:MAG: bacterial Ig-like domain-containing protein [Clostridia bacterium]|nr:bacterial Ig-like domain-containing protein [Clostridia bacterium]